MSSFTKEIQGANGQDAQQTAVQMKPKVLTSIGIPSNKTRTCYDRHGRERLSKQKAGRGGGWSLAEGFSSGTPKEWSPERCFLFF